MLWDCTPVSHFIDDVSGTADYADDSMPIYMHCIIDCIRLHRFL
jgi:hypothetical protein